MFNLRPSRGFVKMTSNFFRLWVSGWGRGEGLKSSASRGCARGAWGLEGYVMRL